MEWGVRQVPKKDPMHLNMVFKLELEKVCVICEEFKVGLFSSAGCKWSQGHLEYVDEMQIYTEQICHGNGE